MDRLWNRGLTGEDAEGPDGTPAPVRLDAELGYGFGLYRGLLTPWGGFGMSDDRREYRLGGRFTLGSSFGMNLQGWRTEGETADGTGIRLTVGSRF